jgi:hypothetical protein
MTGYTHILTTLSSIRFSLCTDVSLKYMGLTAQWERRSLHVAERRVQRHYV